MRASGILLPVSSLPSAHGIGTLGKEAFEFVDFLEKAGQSYWQVLPVGPTGFADSPYQSFSAFAGNPYFIDLDTLCADGLLKPEDIGNNWGNEETKVDYGLIYKKRFNVLEKAAKALDKTDSEYVEFCEKNAFWLDDYSLFMAIKKQHNDEGLDHWAEDLRLRKPAALEAARQKHAATAEFWRVVQFLFFKQWAKLKTYANAKGIKIIGDIPLYVSPDSSDLWASPRMFLVDDNARPSQLAGVPPDSFSASGQLWGNPIYDWLNHRRTKYEWWIKRLASAMELYDVIRIDHFRALASYYAIPAGETTALKGEWRPGPGMDFVRHIKKALPKIEIIAEDLGILTPDVYTLLERSGFPGMKILQFAFSPDAGSEYLPHRYEQNTVVYTGTHDNMTTCQWIDEANEKEVEFAQHYLGVDNDNKNNLCHALMRSAFMSVADTVILPMQDWLLLGKAARINFPSTIGGNWLWRITKDDLSDELCDNIYEWSRIYSRLNPAAKQRVVSLAPRPKIGTADKMRRAEKAAVRSGISEAKLMENAGRGAAQRLMEIAEKEGAKKQALILCGKGGNAGDGYAMARFLHKNNWQVSILPVYGKEAKIAKLAWENRKKLPEQVKFCDIESADFNSAFIVDAVFGIGFSGTLPKNAEQCFEKAKEGNGICVALDVPSGMLADTGAHSCAFCAQHTFSFGMHKTGVHKNAGKAPVGELSLIEIGL